MPQVLVGPLAYQPFLVEVVRGRGEGCLSPGIFDHALHGKAGVGGRIGSAPAQGGAFTIDVVNLDVRSKWNEPGNYRPGTGQKIMGKGVVRYGDFFQTPEPIVGRGTGHDRLSPDGDLAVRLRVSGHIVCEPSGKIVEGHVSTKLKGFGLDLSYHTMSEEEYFGSIGDDRVVFQLSRSF